MAIDCTGCAHKHTVPDFGHCRKFNQQPQFDECGMHSKKQAATPAAEPSGSYIWLGQTNSMDGINHVNV